MDDANLVRMANQIADFYTPYTEAEAIEGVAIHLKKFWDPRMRDRLIALSRTCLCYTSDAADDLPCSYLCCQRIL